MNWGQIKPGLHIAPEKTFREYLKEKADEYERKTDISQHIETIKRKMEYSASLRKFHIYLIDPTGTGVISFNSSDNSASFFIPKEIVSWKYIQLFKQALEKLGFDQDSITTSLGSYGGYDCWALTLEW
jgi:hypothetical protein